MSRLIIKNLPKGITKEELREHFSVKGFVTDVKLHYTKEGIFRRFGFVGYKTEEEAKAAVIYFNQSYIKTSKIIVQFAKNRGDEEVPRPWSKYSSKSSAFQRHEETREERMQKIKKLQGSRDYGDSKTEGRNKGKKAKQHKDQLLDELRDAEKNQVFQDFLKVHVSGHGKPTWTDDVYNVNEEKSSAYSAIAEKQEKKRERDRVVEVTSIKKRDNHGEEPTDDLESGTSDSEAKPVESTAEKGSDLQWLRSKVRAVEKEDEKLFDAAKSDGSDTDDSDEEGAEDAQKYTAEKVNKISAGDVSLTIKLRGLPFKSDEKAIIDFLSPLQVVDIRLITNSRGAPKGVAYVDLVCKDDVKKALGMNGSCMGKRYIEVFEAKQFGARDEKSLKPWETKSQLGDQACEPISESGRLFIRNLPFSCTEEEILKLFEAFGPLTEVHLPVDKSTKAGIGIAFVTFMMPEHAVTAFNALDGKIFQGRILHLLPGDAKRENSEAGTQTKGSSSYKRQKENKLKSTSGSSHNWNTLFLGANAVADVMAERLKTTKSKLLSNENRDSLAVRMALGETQIVSETRAFLVAQGVKLDVFGQAATKRSNTVILVKNLPTDTTEAELVKTFRKYGEIPRLVLPPLGVTALIEFLRPSQAKEAFQHLAYSKFKHVPLYLEWAPIGVFSESAKSASDVVSATQLTGDGTTGEAKTTELIEDIETTASKAIDITGGSSKGIGVDCSSGNSVLFVKNLNFETSDEVLQEKFRRAGFSTHVTIARKKDAKRPNQLLSMGYGFVEFISSTEANEALIRLQHIELDRHKLELKRSSKLPTGILTHRQKAVETEATGNKILVRNVPFEANKREIEELFGAFGELKMLRMPKKVSGTGSHRGFAFVEFFTTQDAKRAFASLCQSTHLYGRRLVLEWAESGDTVDSIRKRTVKHYHEDSKVKKKKQEFLADIEDATVAEE